ncbi:MAG TPA: hypothetical protein VFG33_06660, partial [Kribbella sp.]|nr:hypothetical protein [Kribbella sp.]
HAGGRPNEWLTAPSRVATLRIMVRLSAAVGTLAALLLTANCSTDRSAPEPSPSTPPEPSSSTAPQPTTTPPAVPVVGSITPTGKPIQTVLPSPSASIGAACLTRAERLGILTFRAQHGAPRPRRCAVTVLAGWS